MCYLFDLLELGEEECGLVLWVGNVFFEVVVVVVEVDMGRRLRSRDVLVELWEVVLEFVNVWVGVGEVVVWIWGKVDGSVGVRFGFGWDSGV